MILYTLIFPFLRPYYEINIYIYLNALDKSKLEKRYMNMFLLVSLPHVFKRPLHVSVRSPYIHRFALAFFCFEFSIPIEVDIAKCSDFEHRDV